MAELSEDELKHFTDASRDPVVTDGDKYKVVFENERVRVLEYRDSPGQKTSPHFHSDYVMCSLASFKRRLTVAPGKQIEVDVKPGMAVWGNAQSHVGENIGDTDTHVIIVELKTP